MIPRTHGADSLVLRGESIAFRPERAKRALRVAPHFDLTGDAYLNRMAGGTALRNRSAAGSLGRSNTEETLAL